MKSNYPRNLAIVVQERTPRLGSDLWINESIADGNSLQIDLRKLSSSVLLQDVGSDGRDVVASIALTFYVVRPRNQSSVLELNLLGVLMSVSEEEEDGDTSYIEWRFGKLWVFC